MRDYMEQLRAKRDILAREVERIDGLIARQEHLEADIAAVIRDMDYAMPSRHENQSTDEPSNANARSDASGLAEVGRAKRGPNGSPADEIVDAAKKALRDNDRPMTRYELVDAVEKAGLTVGGVDKARNMGTILWRSKQFKNAGDGYWPADDDPPLPHDYHDPDEFDMR